MGDITETENKFLNELVKDCITYRLTETESLEYIKTDENTDIDRGPDLLPINISFLSYRCQVACL